MQHCHDGHFCQGCYLLSARDGSEMGERALSFCAKAIHCACRSSTVSQSWGWMCSQARWQTRRTCSALELCCGRSSLWSGPCGGATSEKSGGFVVTSMSPMHASLLDSRPRRCGTLYVSHHDQHGHEVRAACRILSTWACHFEGPCQTV